MKMHWLIVKRASEALLFGLVFAIAGDVIIFIFVDYGMPSEDFSGCYAYDAMLIGFECKGFPAASLVSAWLNWPLWLLYGSLFAVFSVRAAVMAVVVWAPLVAYILARRSLARSAP